MGFKWAKDDKEFESLIEALKEWLNTLHLDDGYVSQIWFVGKTFKGEYIAFDFNQKIATKIQENLENKFPRIIITETYVYKDILQSTPNYPIGFDGMLKLINSNIKDPQNRIDTVMVPGLRY